MELQYAPPAKSPHRPLFVIIAGLATTGVALIGVYLIHVMGGTNVLRWYLNGLFPMGAIITGLVASSGYGVASIRTGLKIRRSLLATILVLQVAAYFAAQYAEFLSFGPLVNVATGRPVTFVEYFHAIVTQSHWSDNDGHGAAKAFGWKGYGLLGLEITGFVVGSLLVPVGLRKAPYCELCQVYMDDKDLCIFPASVWAKTINKSDPTRVASYRAEQEGAMQQGLATLARLVSLGMDGEADAFRRELDVLQKSSNRADDLPARIALKLVYCPRCNNGYLGPELRVGEGNAVRKTSMQQTEVGREVIRAIRQV